MASVKDLTPYGIRIETCRRIATEDFAKLERQGCRPSLGDVLIAKDGATALDTVCLIKKNHEVVLLSSVAILRPNPDKVNSAYLAFYLDADPVRRYMKAAFTTGAAIPRVVLKDLKRTQIRLPPLPIQRRIASILSTYDDLIENNSRRIAILEEMARRIYEEWFVHFRFSGHEGVKLVETELGMVPEGWQVVPLERLCVRITDGAHHSPDSTSSGRPMASVKDMRAWGFDIKGCRLVSEDDYKLLVHNNCRPLVGDILIAKDGANLNKHTFLVTEDLDLVLLSSIAILRPASDVGREFLVAALKSDDVSQRIKNSRSGAAIPRIILKDFRRLPLVLPPDWLRSRFESLVGPFHELCRSLSKTNTNLRAQRDLLLPKLISGEIDASELPDDAVLEAAE